jgi:hypothetical protein
MRRPTNPTPEPNMSDKLNRERAADGVADAAAAIAIIAIVVTTMFIWLSGMPS